MHKNPFIIPLNGKHTVKVYDNFVFTVITDKKCKGYL